MKQTFFIIVFFFSPYRGFSQDSSLILPHAKWDRNTTIGLSIANFSILGITQFDHLFFTGYIANQLGFFVEHELPSKPMKLKLYAGYSEWNLNPFFDRILYEPAPYTSYRFVRQYVQSSKNFNEIGALRYRKGYRMIDLAATKEHKIGHHCFTSGIGGSLTWGRSYYLVQRYFNTSWNSYMYIMDEKKENYLGIVLPLRYDFLFLRERCAVGIQGSLRKYFGLQSVQIDYGLHINANF